LWRCVVPLKDTVGLKDRIATALLSPLALAGGIFIGYADSRSDDEFITLGILIGFSFLLGVLGPRRPWLWAFLTGIWVPLLDSVLPKVGLAPTRPGESFGLLSALGVAALVLAVCFTGAHAGAFLGRAARRSLHAR
jgi:hypothetical protein